MSKSEAHREPCVVIAGVGSRAGIGGALCEAALERDLTVIAASRNTEKLDTLADSLSETPGGKLLPMAVDMADPESVERLFQGIDDQGYRPSMVVFNAAEANLPEPFMEMSAARLEEIWKSGCFAGFMVARSALSRMLPVQQGTLVFTGASGSLRGKPGFAAFAAAKSGLRAMAQSLAREFGPQGIHVAHVIIDGAVDGQRVRDAGGGIFRSYIEAKGEDGVISPRSVAECYFYLHGQDRSAWTHELELRPYKETF